MNQKELTEEAVRNAIALIAAAGNEDILGGDLIVATVFADPIRAPTTLAMLAAMCSELLGILGAVGGYDPNQLLQTYALRLAEDTK